MDISIEQMYRGEISGMKKWGTFVAGTMLFAGTLLSGCGTSSGAGSSGSAKPITINFYSVGGSDSYYKDVLIPMFEKATDGKYKVQYGRGGWQDVVNKIKAEGKHVDIDVVASGIDGVPAGAQAGVWEQLIPKYSKDVRYDELNDFGKAYATAFDGYGVPLMTALGGPAIAYNSDKVPNPPTTYSALKTWISQHPNQFMYATVPTSGPGRGFYFGLIQSLGENMNDPSHLTKTYSYLTDINKYISTYPSKTSDTFKQLNDGSVDIVPHLPGWFAQLYSAGQVPPNVKLAPLTGAKQVLDAQFYCMPKNLDAVHQQAALKFINFAMSAKANAQIYSIFNVPTNKNATIDMLDPKLKSVYMKGVEQLPAEFKNGDTLTIPKDDWVLFPKTDILLQNYDEWQKQIQAQK